MVVLPILALTQTGEPKSDVDSGTVRVFQIVGGAVSEVLGSTPLVNVAGTLWSYEWEPVTLPAGQYFAEYTLTDSTATAHFMDQLDVHYLPSAADIRLLVQEAAGGMELTEAGQQIIYDEDGTTPLATANMFDASGTQTRVNPVRREPVG
jgi:hypothetical protein